MSLVLEGTLDDVGLADLLRLVARERRSGALRVTVDGRTWSFVLRDGNAVAADVDAGACEIEPGLRGVVRHRRGAFRLEPAGAEESECEGTPVHAETLAQVCDMEMLRFSERLEAAGGDEAVPIRGGFPTPRQMEALSPEARAFYALTNGERRIADLIVRSRLDPEVALDALAELIEQQLVACDGSASAGGRIGRLARDGVSVWRDALAAACPLAVLVAWLGLASAGAGPGGALTPDPFQIRHDPLAAARAAHEVERLRAAVEAYRFVEGRPPERLVALAEQGYVPEPALTDARGRPYYYSRRGDEFVLLAPER